ncbi:MAG TPA: DinB family protein [Symbiobacteriaceae bacterium]
MKALDLFPFRQEVRTGTLKAVQNLPPEHLEWKPPNGVHSIMDWLRHIAQMEDWWIQAGVMGRRDFAPRRKGFLADLPEVLGYLEETRGVTEQLLQEWPVEKLRETRVVPVKGDYRGKGVTLHWIMAHQFDHERHHRAQICLYLRLMGLEPPTLT